MVNIFEANDAVTALSKTVIDCAKTFFTLLRQVLMIEKVRSKKPWLHSFAVCLI